MYGRLPENLEQTCQRLIGQWIGRRRGLDERIDGLLTMQAAFRTMLEPILGEASVRAILRRARYVTAQKYPGLGNVTRADGSLDAALLRAALEAAVPREAEKALGAMVESLFRVLYGLLGASFIPLLMEVEESLQARCDKPHRNKEEP